MNKTPAQSLGWRQEKDNSTLESINFESSYTFEPAIAIFVQILALILGIVAHTAPIAIAPRLTFCFDHLSKTRKQQQSKILMTQCEPHAPKGGEVTRFKAIFRSPTPEDGRRVWELIAACPPLDQNSLYCNLLQCADFAKTCVLTEIDGELAGWVSAYRPPDDRETLFIWQVAVHEKARGLGLARSMIEELLSRDSARGVVRLKTTITPDNEASWALFRSLAQKLSAPFVSQAWFEREAHFGGRHETEHLVTIGPFGAFAAR